MRFEVVCRLTGGELGDDFAVDGDSLIVLLRRVVVLVCSQGQRLLT